MRILMVTGFYPPASAGIERHVYSLGQALVERGHEVAVATLGRPGAPAFERHGQVRVYRMRGTLDRLAASRLAGGVYLEPGAAYAPPAPDPVLTAALTRVVRQERPDVVHGHDWLVRSFLPLKAWSGARLVVTLHEYGLACARWTLIHQDAPCSGPGLAKCLACAAGHYGPAKGAAITLANWALGPALRATVDQYLAVSQAVAQGNALEGRGVPFTVVPNFIPDDAGRPPAGEPPCLADLPAGDFMLFVGALRRYKGVDVLLRAYAGLSGAPPLVLIGSAWRDSPTALPPNAVLLRDWPHEAVMHAWRRSLFGLAPSVWPEPCPTVVLEAMASGRPVIVSHLGGLPELVVDGQTGLVVPPDDAAALRGAMRRLLEDAALRQRLGAAGRQRVLAFQAGAVVPRIESIYRGLLRRGAGRPDHPGLTGPLAGPAPEPPLPDRREAGSAA